MKRSNFHSCLVWDVALPVDFCVKLKAVREREKVGLKVVLLHPLKNCDKEERKKERKKEHTNKQADTEGKKAERLS